MSADSANNENTESSKTNPEKTEMNNQQQDSSDSVKLIETKSSKTKLIRNTNTLPNSSNCSETTNKLDEQTTKKINSKELSSNDQFSTSSQNGSVLEDQSKNSLEPTVSNAKQNLTLPNNSNNFSSKQSNNNLNQNITSNGSVNSIDPVFPTSTATVASAPYINYYPYVARAQPVAPYPSQIDVNTTATWSQAMAAAAAMAAMSAADPLAIATYMNVAGGFTPADLAQYEQFSFGFTPAFGFGYTGNGSIDYNTNINNGTSSASNVPNSINQPVQSSSTAVWTAATTSPPNTNMMPIQPNANSSNSNDSNNLININTSTSNQTNSTQIQNNGTKWFQLVQDPSAIQHMNELNAVVAAAVQHQSQLSPVDLYSHNNYRHHHHYQPRHQLLNYHHYNHYNHPTQSVSTHYHHNQSPHLLHHQHQHQHQLNHLPHHYNKHTNFYQQLNKLETGFNNLNFNYNQYDNNHNNKFNNYNESKPKSSSSSTSSASSKQNSTSNAQHQTQSNNLQSNENNFNINNDNNNKNSNNNNDVENKSNDSSKTDSKTWASIVGYSSSESQSQQISNILQQNQEHQENSDENNSSKSINNGNNNNTTQNNFKSNYSSNNLVNKSTITNSSLINKPSQSQNNQSFDFNNRSFPPISINSINNKKFEMIDNINLSQLNELNINSQNTLNTIRKPKNSNFEYNYQRQLQSKNNNLPSNSISISSYTSTNKSNINRIEPSLEQNNQKPIHFYKKHHPTPPTISSFMTNLDKSLFIDDKKSTTNKPTDTTSVIHLNQIKVQVNPNAFNPKEFNTAPKAARFFVIKSYSEDDVHRSIKYNIWCSTEHGNRRLDAAYFKGDGQVPVYLFFSVNGSGHFCGMAEMRSRVDYNKKTDVWSQDKWRGCFQVQWIYVKDVPNSLLRNIKLENNDNKPVTNSRDTQEIPFDKGKQVLKIFHTYNQSSSILDDFEHYERKQEEESLKNFNRITTKNSYGTEFTPNSCPVTRNPSKIVENQSNNNTNDKVLGESNHSITNNSSTTLSTTAPTTNTTTSSSVSSSPSTSSSSSTSSVDESKENDPNKQQHQQKQQQNHQHPQLIIAKSS